MSRSVCRTVTVLPATFNKRHESYAIQEFLSISSSFEICDICIMLAPRNNSCGSVNPASLPQVTRSAALFYFNGTQEVDLELDPACELSCNRPRQS